MYEILVRLTKGPMTAEEVYSILTSQPDFTQSATMFDQLRDTGKIIESPPFTYSLHPDVRSNIVKKFVTKQGLEIQYNRLTGVIFVPGGAKLPRAPSEIIGFIETSAMTQQNLLILEQSFTSAQNASHVKTRFFPGVYLDKARELHIWEPSDIKPYTIQTALSKNELEFAVALRQAQKIPSPPALGELFEAVQQIGKKHGVLPAYIDFEGALEEITTAKFPVIERYQKTGGFHAEMHPNRALGYIHGELNLGSSRDFYAAVQALQEQGLARNVPMKKLKAITRIRFSPKAAHYLLVGLGAALIAEEVNAAPATQKFSISVTRSTTMGIELITAASSFAHAVRIGLAYWPATVWSVLIAEMAGRAVELFSKQETRDPLLRIGRTIVEGFAPEIPKVEEIYDSSTAIQPFTQNESSASPSKNRSTPFQFPEQLRVSAREMMQSVGLSSEHPFVQQMDEMRRQLNAPFSVHEATVTSLNSTGLTLASAERFPAHDFSISSLGRQRVLPARPDIFSELRQTVAPALPSNTLSDTCSTLFSLWRVNEQLRNPIGSAIRNMTPTLSIVGHLRSSVAAATSTIHQLFNP